MKKVLSVAMAFVMLIGCLSVMASAVTTNGVIEITVAPTASNYSKGDIVTFEVSYETSSELGMMGCAYYMQFGFDSSVFETIEDLNSDKGWADTSTFIYSGYPIENNIKLAYCHAQAFIGEGRMGTLANLTDADKTKGWDSVLTCIQTPNNSCDDDYSTKKAAFAFKLKVKEDASDTGCYTIGVTDWAINNGKCEIDEEQGSIAGPSGSDYGFTNDKMFATVDSVISVATAGSILKPMSSQIRFKGVGSDGDFTNYGGTFDVRTRATISTADFNAKFTDEATAKAGISEFGFIYKAASVGTFDLATAKGVAQGTAAEGYVKKTCNYIQRTAEGYNFTCLIQGIADADHTDVVNCIAYVCFNGEYIFFDAPATADYNTLYTTYHK